MRYVADSRGEPRIRIGPAKPVASGRDRALEVAWSLVVRELFTDDGDTYPGLFIETSVGSGGGGGSSRTLDPSPYLLNASMRALERGLVAVFGAINRQRSVQRVSVELADGTTKAADLVLTDDPVRAAFFVAILDRRPVRVAADTSDGGECVDLDASRFQFRVPD